MPQRHIIVVLESPGQHEAHKEDVTGVSTDKHPGWGGVGGAHQKLVEATHIDQIATVKLGTVQTRLSSPAPFALNISRTMPTAAQQMKSAGPNAAASSAVLYANSSIPAPTEPHSSPFLSC